MNTRPYNSPISEKLPECPLETDLQNLVYALEHILDNLKRRLVDISQKGHDHDRHARVDGVWQYVQQRDTMIPGVLAQLVRGQIRKYLQLWRASSNSLQVHKGPVRVARRVYNISSELDRPLVNTS